MSCGGGFFDDALVEFEVAVLDHSGFAEGDRDQGGQDCGENEADQDETDPVSGSDGGFGSCCDVIDPAGVNADLSDQSAGAHAGCNGCAVHLHFEKAGGDGTGDGGGDDRGEPDHGIADDVAHLQHGGADALGDKAAPFVFLKGHECKADHLCTASRDGGAAGKSGQAEGRADGCGGDGQGQSDSDNDGDQDTHEEGLLVGRPHDDGSDTESRFADGGSDQ